MYNKLRLELNRITSLHVFSGIGSGSSAESNNRGNRVYDLEEAETEILRLTSEVVAEDPGVVVIVIIVVTLVAVVVLSLLSLLSLLSVLPL